MDDGIALKTQPLKTIDDVKRVVAAYFRVSVRELESASRAPRVAHPRHVAMALAYKRLQKLGATYEAIGTAFGGRHHTSVVFACRKFGIRCDDANPHSAFRGSAKRARAALPMRPCKPPMPRPPALPALKRARTPEEISRRYWMREAGFLGAA